jgi:hypothetical protein
MFTASVDPAHHTSEFYYMLRSMAGFKQVAPIGNVPQRLGK